MIITISMYNLYMLLHYILNVCIVKNLPQIVSHSTACLGNGYLTLICLYLNPNKVNNIMIYDSYNRVGKVSATFQNFQENILHRSTKFQ